MGKRTLDLQSYGAMPQPTALTHTSKGHVNNLRDILITFVNCAAQWL
jgi:hypothetical protein